MKTIKYTEIAAIEAGRLRRGRDYVAWKNMRLIFDQWLRIEALLVSIGSLGFAVFQWRKRVRLHDEVSAFLHGLNGRGSTGPADCRTDQ
jgi:hypothetical protein